MNHIKSEHLKRLKFQPDKSETDTSEFISMYFHGTHETNSKNYKFKSKDIQQLKLFIDENKNN